MMLRNPQALYILRNLEKFENSIKIHFFIRKIAANFNNFQGSRTSVQIKKPPTDLMYVAHAFTITQSFKTA